MRLVSVLGACADETRIAILRELGVHGERCVSDLVAACRVSQPKVSRHLAYLRRVGVVEDRKEGLNVFYRLADLIDSDCEGILRIVSRLHVDAEVAPEPPPTPLRDVREELDVELL